MGETSSRPFKAFLISAGKIQQEPKYPEDGVQGGGQASEILVLSVCNNKSRLFISFYMQAPGEVLCMLDLIWFSKPPCEIGVFTLVSR